MKFKIEESEKTSAATYFLNRINELRRIEGAKLEAKKRIKKVRKAK